MRYLPCAGFNVILRHQIFQFPGSVGSYTMHASMASSVYLCAHQTFCLAFALIVCRTGLMIRTQRRFREDGKLFLEKGCLAFEDSRSKKPQL